MIGIGGATQVFLATGPTDMRKGFEGLFALAREDLVLLLGGIELDRIRRKGWYQREAG